MTEWTNPRHADTVAAYRKAQRPDEARRPRPGFAGRLPATRTYGSGTVVMTYPETRATYTTTTGRPDS